MQEVREIMGSTPQKRR